ncbi:MAG: type II toxin-antitoxin system death-on-curing family toxin [bacterium]
MSDLPQPKWLSFRGVVGIHARVLAEHGGVPGIHDMAMLESALARPINRWMYEKAPIVRQAADYAYALAQNHPFKEKNELTAFIAAYTFLRINGYDFTAPADDVALKIRELSKGTLTEERLSDWFSEHTASID